MDGKDDRPMAGAGREGPSGDRQDVCTRVLHRRQMEERGDRGGKPVLRPGRLSEANRRVVSAMTAAALPAPGTYGLDPPHTFVYFAARHLVVGMVRGRF